MNLAAPAGGHLDPAGRWLGPWAILATREHSQAPSPSPEAAVRPEAPLVPTGRMLALQRSIGNRAVAAMVQRLQPSDVPPAQQPGGDISSRAEEEAGIAAASLRRANARRLLPDEVDEVAAMPALIPPAGPGIVLGPGTRKLLNAVDALGKRRAGPTSGYKRDPASEGGLPVFVSGNPDDPDGRIAVTADGLLEVTKTTRTQKKAKSKGEAPPPPVVTHDTTLVDLQGTKIKLESGQIVADVFLAQARSKEEKAAQERVLTALKASETKVAGGPEDAGWTVGALTTAATSGEYLQVSYLDKKRTIQSELLKDVIAAMDKLRAEFEAFKAPIALATTLGGSVPSHEAFARAFAAKVSPTLFLAAAAAQSQLDQSTAAKSAADAEVASAKEAHKQLKARKGVPKAEQAAHKKALADAAAKLSSAESVAKAAKREVTNDKLRLDGLVVERERFAKTISWILDPAKTTEQRAAASAGSLCNVLSYFLYGKAVGVVPPEMDFRDYYLAEVKLGRVRYYEGDAVGVFWGEGSSTWVEQRDLIRMEDPDLKTHKWGDPPPVIDPMTHPTRKAELDTFLASGANVALTWQDFNNAVPSKPHHFLLIVKGPDGVWRNLDHVTSSWRRRGAMTDWGRVFRIETDRALIEAAKRKLAEQGVPATTP